VSVHAVKRCDRLARDHTAEDEVMSSTQCAAGMEGQASKIVPGHVPSEISLQVPASCQRQASIGSCSEHDAQHSSGAGSDIEAGARSVRNSDHGVEECNPAVML